MRRKTNEDPSLNRVRRFIIQGWPKKIEEEWKPYWLKKDELSVEEGVVWRLGRFIPPLSLRKEVMRTLHSGHPGIEGMKSLARYYTWWPGMDKDLEEYVKTCNACQEGKRARSTTVPLEPS